VKIDFPNEEPSVMYNNTGVAFSAQIDGNSITVEITEDALRKHFGAKSQKKHDLLSAFISGKSRIHEVARRKIPHAAGRLLLVAADF